MSERSASVALFFDDAELGGHLRAALTEHGARIAHEGPLGSFDEAQLRQAGVDVVVVNLDDAVDDATLDRIYALVEANQATVVFNDAQASRGLDGWDRARWARHLAAKALGSNAIDPPRPEHAREVEPVIATVTPVHPGDVVPVEVVPVEHVAPTITPDSVEEIPHHPVTGSDSETLAAELEALLASDEAAPQADHDFGSGLKFSLDDDLPPLHDGDFGQTEAAIHETPAEPEPIEHAHVVPQTDDIGPDHLTLALLDDDVQPPALDKAPLAQATHTSAAPEWGLVAHDEPPAAGQPFGIEKMSATDYLAPNVEATEGHPHIEAGLSLELMSIEEAIAPRERYEPHESHLQELESAIVRLLVLGAARDSATSLSTFLAVLPGNFKLPILLTQHLDNGSAEHVAQSLAMQIALPVKVAAAGMRAKPGEVLLVPRGQQVRVLRDGRVELTAANDAEGEQAPSIDHSFTMAADVFGRDALAIVFAGKATDAVAGSQAIHDRGGEVWVESSADHYADMVHGVLAERLASFSGSPQELAARLVEDLFR